MSSPEFPDTTPEFTRRSETESICMHCFQSVKTDRYTPLQEAEDIHADVCLQKVDSAVRYALLW
jgi:hypothetical protein